MQKKNRNGANTFSQYCMPECFLCNCNTAISFSSCRSTILLDSKSLLRGRAVSDQAIAEALVSTMLLEDSSPRQALADFLLARKASVHHLLNQPQHGCSILTFVTPVKVF